MGIDREAMLLSFEVTGLGMLNRKVSQEDRGRGRTFPKAPAID